MKATAIAVLLVGVGLLYATPASVAQDEGKGKASELTGESQSALQKLYATSSAAKTLGAKAHSILVFPSVKKAGLVVGGQYGEGTLLKGNEAVAYYKTTGASVGLQAGGQQYGYAMFLMNQKAVDSLNAANGFEVGVGPSVVVVDEGAAKNLTTTTMKDDIYAFVFGQKGLMAGVGLQGNKISKIKPK